MTNQTCAPIKKRPLKAEIRFLVHDEPPVGAPPNPSSGNGPSNGRNPSQAELTPMSPATGPHSLPPNAPQHNLPNYHFPQSFQGPLRGLTPPTLTESRTQGPGGNIILNEVNYNRSLRGKGASVKSEFVLPLRRASQLPASSTQHPIYNHAPSRPSSSIEHANLGSTHIWRSSQAIVGDLPHRRKRSSCSDMGTSEIQLNRQKKRDGPGGGNYTPSFRPRASVQTPFSRGEVQPNSSRAHIASQRTEEAIVSPIGATDPQATSPPGMQEVRNDVPCDICNARFYNAEAVQRHKISQHRSENSLESIGWECPACRIVLKSRQNLRRHERVHGEDATLPCPICRVLFTTERSRTIHMRDLHALATSTRGPSRKSYTCAECSYASIQKTNVKRHVDSVHRKVRRYHCPFGECSYRASTKSNLDAHMVSYMHSSVKEEDEEETDEDAEEMNLTSEEGNRLEHEREDSDEGGKGGAGAALPNVSSLVY